MMITFLITFGFLVVIFLLFSIFFLVKHDPVPGFQMHLDGSHLLGDILARALYQPLPKSEASCAPALVEMLMLLPNEPPMLAATSLTAFISIEFGMKMPGCPSVS